MADRLRFAVLCCGNSLTAADLRMIERLLEREEVLCVAALEIGSEPPIPGGLRWLPYRRWRASQLRVSLYERFPHIPKIDCPLALGDEVYTLSAHARARIVSLDLDFCLQAGYLPLGGDLAGLARFGVWTLIYGNDANPREKYPPGFAAIESGDTDLTVTLERLGAPRQVLRQAVVNTFPRSYGLTLSNAITAGVDLPALVTRQILKSGSLPIIRTHSAVTDSPRKGRVARFFLRQAAAWIKYQWLGTIRSEMWNVGIVDRPIYTFLDGLYPSRIEWLQPLQGRKFLADPFAVEVPGGFQLLGEEFDYDRYQGYITSSIYQPGVPLSDNRMVIDEGLHMSYPFPVVYNGQQYCIPESHQRRETVIYRMQDGADPWVPVASLLPGFAALDSTFVQHNGRWWLFCTLQDDLPECKLYIWHAADLIGPWEPHFLNPVKCDVRCSRPGGTPFVHNGEIYRPAQDSSAGYGNALSINRILRLTPDEFEEETVAHIKAPAHVYYRDGIHTLSAAGNRTLLDGKRMAPIPRLALRRLLHKFRRLTGLS